MKSAIGVFLAVVIAVGAAGQLDAQQNGQQADQATQRRLARRVPATVVLVRELPARDAAAVIVRRPNAEPRDVILLRRATANGERLVAAAAHLVAIRRRAGDVPTEMGMFRVRDGVQAKGGLARRSLHTADVVVSRLRVAEPRQVPGIGVVPAYEVYLPSREMREARGW